MLLYISISTSLPPRQPFVSLWSKFVDRESLYIPTLKRLYVWLMALWFLWRWSYNSSRQSIYTSRRIYHSLKSWKRPHWQYLSQRKETVAVVSIYYNFICIFQFGIEETPFKKQIRVDQSNLVHHLSRHFLPWLFYLWNYYISESLQIDPCVAFSCFVFRYIVQRLIKFRRSSSKLFIGKLQTRLGRWKLFCLSVRVAVSLSNSRFNVIHFISSFVVFMKV